MPLIDAKGLRQMTDSGALETIVDEVLAANAKSVEEYRAGKDKAFNALVGQAMKATRGKANPTAGQRAAAQEARLTPSEPLLARGLQRCRRRRGAPLARCRLRPRDAARASRAGRRPRACFSRASSAS